MNYKIKVENEVESRDVQELFFELGFEWEYNNIGKNYHKDGSIGFLYADNGCITTGSKDNSEDYFKYRSPDNKEITIQQLKDLVVLKRNSPKDANVLEGSCLYDLYLTESKELYFYHCGKNKWILSNLNGDDDYYGLLKPIEKPMKEYLVKDMETYDYFLTKNHSQFIGAIEIPDGAEVAVYYKYSDKVFFWKDAGKTHWGESSRLKLDWYDCKANMFARLDEFLNEWADQAAIIWKRENNQTIASAVESVNDKVASAELARQESKEWDLGDYAFAESDALIESNVEQAKHAHYKKDVKNLDCIDVYRVLELFEVKSHAVGHAVKKLLCSGQRGAKDEIQDIQEAIDSLNRHIEMIKENDFEL